MDEVKGLSGGYQCDKHKKMIKSDFWAIVEGWDQITKFGNFQPKSSLRTQTQKGMLLETEIPWFVMK